jgi:small-conductance mechanosensitive channel
MWRYAWALLLLAFAAAFAASQYFSLQSPLLDRGLAAFGIAIVGLALSSLLGTIISRRVRERKRAYELKSVVSYAIYACAMVLIVFTLIGSPDAFAVMFGIIAAGLVIVFQDSLLSLAAFAYILVARPFTIGDRIEVDSRTGDVIDFGPLSTNLIEIGNWVRGDQATGRVISMPNNFIFRKQVANYTKHFDFIWDEITLPVSYQADWQKAKAVMLDAARKSQSQLEEEARREMQSLEATYFFEARDIAPAVFVTPTDNWLALTLRYVVKVKQRRATRSAVSSEILAGFQKEGIAIASETLRILGP